jgi:hypothetical protein
MNRRQVLLGTGAAAAAAALPGKAVVSAAPALPMAMDITCYTIYIRIPCKLSWIPIRFSVDPDPAEHRQDQDDHDDHQQQVEGIVASDVCGAVPIPAAPPGQQKDDQQDQQG